MSSGDPVNEQLLRALLRPGLDEPVKLEAPETRDVEFKANFNKKAIAREYGRTMAGFANAGGGYLIFGVTDEPRTYPGMASNNFETCDDAELTNELLKCFTPEIHWRRGRVEDCGRNFGFIYVYESRDKPIVALADAGDKVKVGDVFYRYQGQTSRIRPTELRALIARRIEDDRLAWLRQIERIAAVGPTNVGVIDLLSGEIVGPRGTFAIDEGLLPQLQFIREGQFDEKIGAPTLRLVGDVHVAGEPAARSVPKAIHEPDLVSAFLDREQVDFPEEYLKAAVHAASAYVPVYYFLHLSGLDRSRGQQLITSEPTSSQTKTRLLQRLHSGAGLAQPLSGASHRSSEKRREHRTAWDLGAPPSLDDNDSVYQFLAMVRSLDRSTIREDDLLPILKQLWENHIEGPSGNLRTMLRQAIAHADHVLYSDRVESGGRPNSEAPPDRSGA